MGFFDRLLGRVETNNPEVAYQAALRELDGKIASQAEQIASLKVRARSEPGYDELVFQAERTLETLRSNRRALELERLTGPAAQKVAEARVHLADDANGLGERASSRALGNVRDDVDALKRRASPGEIDANGVPIHGRRAVLDRKAREQRALEELQRLKADVHGDDDA